MLSDQIPEFVLNKLSINLKQVRYRGAFWVWYPVKYALPRRLKGLGDVSGVLQMWSGDPCTTALALIIISCTRVV